VGWKIFNMTRAGPRQAWAGSVTGALKKNYGERVYIEILGF